ncbi:MAG: mannitol dehydrogenase family protein, partial [Actinocatenispora sp.]
MNRLGRRSWPADPAPVRAVHLGLGAFHRAHQAWYTHRAGGEPVGIAAFTGRRPAAAVPLADQDGRYGLLVRGPAEDAVEVVTSIVEAYDGARVDLLAERLRRPELAVVTMTVTEAGYRRDPDGGLDTGDPDVAADLAALSGAALGDTDTPCPLRTAPARLVYGLAARWRSDAGPVAVLPCDNLIGNGPAARRVVRDLAGRVDAGLAGWIDEQVSFVSSEVDRITPAATDADRAVVAEHLGLRDEASVVTEPFTEWVLAGEFPNGRPDWQDAGARFVDDVAPFEQRKLWLLNGAHSLLAYAGLARGHASMAEAVGDGTLLGWVRSWWEEAARHLPLPSAEVDDYTGALLARFGNPRLRHLLSQVAADGSQKLPVRVLPVLRAERAAGRVPAGAAHVLGAWLAHVRGDGGKVSDP